MLEAAPEGSHAVTPPFLSISKEFEFGHHKISVKN